MGEGLRYNIQHIGDIVIDNFEKVLDSALSSTRGISLTYGIHEMQKDKRKIFHKIGRRLAEIRKTSPEHAVFNDEKLLEHFSKLESLEEEIRARAVEREKKINPTGSIDQYENSRA